MPRVSRLLRNLLVSLLATFHALFRRLRRTMPVEWVYFELHGAVARGIGREPHSYVLRLPRRPRIVSVAELRQHLDYARTAPHLRGVVIRLHHARMSIAVMRELRELLLDFRRSGREVVIHADHLDLPGYWLASAGSRVWMMPRGRLELVGFSAASSAAARPLSRLGIVFHVIRAGLFKSAGEIVGAERVSDEQKQQLAEMLSDLNEVFVSDVAPARGMSVEQFQALIDAGPYSARGAKEAGLVDALGYTDEVRDLLGDGTRARLGTLAALVATNPPPEDWLPLVDRRPKVAVVDVAGLIAEAKSRAVPGQPAVAGSDTLVPALTSLRRRRDVRAVVLRIDSSGGSALASDVIWRATRLLDERKPVIAYMDGVAASGGYYIAVGARRILASPTCITGSIGVFSLRPDASGTFELLGVDRAVVRQGANAGIHRADTPLTDEERAVMQRDVLETYDDFVRVVAEGRGLTPERVRELAEGRVYLATRAKELGLVDELGAFDVAIDAAMREAGLSGPVRLVRVGMPLAGVRALWQAWRENALVDWIAGETRGLRGVQARWLGEPPNGLG